MLGFLEAAAAWFYFSRYDDEQRKLIEQAMSLRASESNSVLRYASHPYFNHISNPRFRFANGHAPHNEAGLRGTLCCAEAKPPGMVRLVAIGGSTTYGMYATYEQSVWPALLQAALRERHGNAIEVINAGTPYYTTYELLGVAAMRVPEFHPDIVLIHTGLNDAFSIGYPDEGGPDNTAFRHAWSYRPLPARLTRAMSLSYAVRVATVLWFASDGYQPYDMAIAIQYPPPTDDQVRAHAPRATGKYFRRNLETLVMLAKQAGAVPVLISEPLNPDRERGQGVYLSAVVDTVARNNRIAKEIAERNGLVFVDAYAAMRDPSYFVDAAHESKAGMAAKAATVAAGVEPVVSKLVKQRGTR